MRVLVLARKDLLRGWSDRRAFVINLLLPLLLTFIMGLSFGGGVFGSSGISAINLVGVGPDLPAAFREQITENLQEGGFFALSWADSAEAARRVREGEAAAAVVLPDGAVSGFFSGEDLEIAVWKDPGRPLKAGIVEQVLRRALQPLQAGEAAYRALWPEDEESPPPGAGDLTWEELFAGDFNTVWKRWRDLEAPDGFSATGEYFLDRMDHQVALTDALAVERLVLNVDDVAASLLDEETAEVNLFAYFLPGFAVFFLMFGAAASARDLHRERAAGTLQRQMLAPITARQVLAGKWLAAVMQGIGQLLVLLLAGGLLFRVDLGPDPWSLLLVVVASAAAAASFFLLLAVLTRSEKLMDNLSTTVVLVAAMVGGNFMPLEAMPAWVHVAGRWVFNYWSNTGFNHVLGEGRSLAENPASVLVLGAMTLGYGLLILIADAVRSRRGGLL